MWWFGINYIQWNKDRYWKIQLDLSYHGMTAWYIFAAQGMMLFWCQKRTPRCHPFYHGHLTYSSDAVVWLHSLFTVFHIGSVICVKKGMSPWWPLLGIPSWYTNFKSIPCNSLSGVPDYFDRNKILSGYDLSHYQVPHCIRVFFYFVWFVFIHHNFQFYFKLCTYCNILDIYLL